MKSIILIIFTGIVLFSILVSVKKKENRGKYKMITAQEAKKMMDSGSASVIVDVRQPDEYKNGHVEGAINIPLDRIERTGEKKLKDKNENILVYCHSGMRSRQASSILTNMGYENIFNFGGVISWKYGLVTD